MLYLYKAVYHHSPQRYRPEHCLLLLCIGVAAGAATAEEIVAAQVVARQLTLTAEAIDWPKLYRFARDYGVANYLDRALRLNVIQDAPLRLREHLEGYASYSQWNSLHITAELLHISNLFQAHHIDVLVLKGPALALAVYRNMFLREYKDLDLLVRQSDIERAKSLLIERGYSLNSETETEEKLFDSFNEPYHISLISNEKETSIEVELHWSVTTSFLPFEFDSDRLWNSVELLERDGIKLSVLSPEELILVLSLHGAKHLWRQLKWVCDTAEFLTHYATLDWNEVIIKAHRSGTRRVLLVNLQLATVLLNVPLPPVVLSEIQSDGVINILAIFVSQLIFVPAQADTLTGQFRIVLFYILLRDKWGDRYPYLLHTLFHHRSRAARTLIIGTVLLIIALLILLIFVVLQKL